jgi:hypothetical protein
MIFWQQQSSVRNSEEQQMLEWLVLMTSTCVLSQRMSQWLLDKEKLLWIFLVE